LRRDTLLRALDGATRLIASSKSLGRAYAQAGIVPEQLLIESSGIDLRAMPARRASTSDGVVRFAMAASLAEHKGIQDLIEAAALLHADSSLRGRWRLTIAGMGQLQGDVETAIASGSVGNGVDYVGRLDRADVLSLMAASDVVILPSRWPENEPVVLLEGAAVGAALIATNVGGCPEMVHPGRSGELVPPQDPVALAAAMAAYVRAPAMAALHGAWNVDHRDDLDEAQTIATLQEQYAMAINAQVPNGERPPVVLCGGSPTPEIASLISHLHQVEPQGLRLRLLWQGWTQPEDWNQAVFYWDWGGRPEVRARALLAGLPVLAAADGTRAPGVIAYRSVLEAAAALVDWPRDRSLLSPLRRTGEVRLREFWRDAGPAPPSVQDGASQSAALGDDLAMRAAALARQHPGFAAALGAHAP
jgi:hypothetical protein